MGLCTNQTCVCPSDFSADQNYSCVPKQVSEGTISLPSACTATESMLTRLFLLPDEFFFENSSGYCYLLDYNMGGFMLNSDVQGGPLGYLKAILNISQVSTEQEKHSFPISALVVIILLSGLFMLITIVVVVVVVIRWLRKKRPTGVNLDRWDSSSSAEIKMISIPGLPRRFNIEELVAATENFKAQIGSGGFGTVYKGTVLDNTVVAVKKITSLGDRGKMEFCAETATIGSIHHANLVKLREWPKRYEIALGMARGLAYLHSGCKPKIIHCDIKPENILLNDDMQVKISDFGLAKLLYDEKSELLTTLRGTRGYLAPEWLTSRGITDKTDVYSYGMVLFELVRGSRNCMFQSSGNENGEGNGQSFSSTSSELQVIYFPLIVLHMHKLKRYMELADRRLEGHVRSEEFEKLVRVALCCVHIVPTLRPCMSNVVAMLEGRLPVGEPRIEALEYLQIYGGKLNEASRKQRGRGSVVEEEVISLMAEELTYL
ncbi:hypothetical protein ACLB2K_050653 [Fragaria x ananassa]